MIQILRKLCWMVQRSRREAELTEELEFHLEEEAEAAEAAGMDREGAKYAARRDLGSVALVTENTRATWGWICLDRFRQDVRYSIRTLRRNPGFAAAAILSLALGIGANTAVFSLLNAVVLKPLAVPNPQELVQFTNSIPLWETGGNWQNSLFGHSQLESLRAHSTTMSGIFGWVGLGRVSLGYRGTSEVADGDACSDNFFSVLGITPQSGRFFLPGEDRSAASVAVLSDRYWRSRFGADPAIVGVAITINQSYFTVVGITPPEFSGTSMGKSPDIWLPLHALDRLRPDPKRWAEPFSPWMLVAGRLRPGISRAQAQAELNVLQRHFLAEQLAISELGGLQNVQRFARESSLQLQAAVNGTGSGLRERYEFPLKLLMAVAGIVLLLSCANIANLLLARASNRRHEIAVRLSLGASRSRLIRQFLTESLVLSAAGGLFAAPLAWGGSVALVRMISNQGSGAAVSVDPEWRTFAFNAGISLLTGILFGLVPALRSTRAGPGGALKEGRRRFGRPARSMEGILVVAQIALSVVLITGAGLFVRTLQKLWSRSAGFDRENVLMFSIDARLGGYPSDRAGSVYREILQRVKALPQVMSACASIVRPGDREFHLLDQVDEIDGRRVPEGHAIRVAWNAMSPGYFSTLATPLISGRDFELRDNETAPKVVIISESLAKTTFPNQSPIGHRLGESTVVGVVKDSLYGGVHDQPRPLLYHPLFQHGPDQGFRWGFVSFELRYGALTGLSEGVHRAVASIDPRLPVFRILTLTGQTEQSLMRERLLATLSSFFGVLALLLACVGLSGLMAYTVSLRTAEIGIRLALGARRDHIMWLVLRETLWLTVAGIAAGVPLTLWAARYAKSVLFGISTSDPLTITATVALLLSAAALAGYLPARRALSVDTTTALKCE